MSSRGGANHRSPKEYVFSQSGNLHADYIAANYGGRQGQFSTAPQSAGKLKCCAVMSSAETFGKSVAMLPNEYP
jgi:hypothetical protein